MRRRAKAFDCDSVEEYLYEAELSFRKETPSSR